MSIYASVTLGLDMFSSRTDTVLQVGNVATVRQYQEAIVVNIVLKDPSFVRSRVLPALLAYESR